MISPLRLDQDSWSFYEYEHQFGTLGRNTSLEARPPPCVSPRDSPGQVMAIAGAPAACESCGVYACSIECSDVVSCTIIPLWASRQEAQHSQHQSLQVHFVVCAHSVGPFGLPRQGLSVMRVVLPLYKKKGRERLEPIHCETN